MAPPMLCSGWAGIGGTVTPPTFDKIGSMAAKKQIGIRQSAVADRRICGWREWASLPTLGIAAIKAKLDTGAKTSALHAWNINTYEVDGCPWVSFCVHPLQRDDVSVVLCNARLRDRRWVTNSGGTRERRYVISTSLLLGADSWLIELTLTNRDEMGFRIAHRSRSDAPSPDRRSERLISRWQARQKSEVILQDLATAKIRGRTL